MIFPLKYNTASQEVPLGFFLDSSTGNVEQTGLTIANTDIRLWKSGATTLATKNSGGATHISNGIYYCVLDATDTNTYGPLEIFIHVSGALAFHKVCTVINTDVYDSLMSASSGSIRSNVTTWNGSAVATPTSTGYPEVRVHSIADNAITNASIASDAEYTLDQIGGAVWDIQRSAHTSTGSFGQGIASVQGNVTGSVNSVTSAVTVGTNNDKTGYTVSTVQDKTGYSLSVAPPTTAQIWSNATRTLTSSGTTPIDYELVASAVWDEQLSLHTTSGSAGKQLADTVTSAGTVYVNIGEEQIANAVWNAHTSNYTSTGSMGRALTSTGTAVIDAADVWNYSTRTLTSTGAAAATLANQEIIINHLEDIKGDGWTDETLVSLQAGVNNGIWGGYGS